MTARPKNLPDFSNPPVVEVVLDVQFERVSGLQAVHAGSLWDEFRDEFPSVQEQPPLGPAFETFGTKPGSDPVNFELSSGPLPFPRLWFLNEGNTQLIQFQPDRFVHNWRKVEENDVYPRYENIKARFFDELTTIERFFHDRGLGELRPNQCEITYVNHIAPIDDQEEICTQPGKVFRFFSSEFAPEVFHQLEDARIQVRFVLLSEDKLPIGRLHINARPATRARDGKRIIALNLTARGAPSDQSIEAVSKFLDFGREKLVRGFAELTTKEMHERWGRNQ